MKGKIYKNIFSAFTAELDFGLISSASVFFFSDGSGDEHEEYDDVEEAESISCFSSSLKSLKSKFAISAFPFFLRFLLKRFTSCCFMESELFLKFNIFPESHYKSL